MKKKQKTPDTGGHYAGTMPVQHSEVVLAEREADRQVTFHKEQRKPSINDDDIEADRHNGSGGAFAATEQEWDEE